MIDYYFLFIFDTNCKRDRRIPLGIQSMRKNETNSEGFHKLFKTLKLIGNTPNLFQINI